MKSFIEKWQKGKTENRLYHSVCIFSNIKQLIERWRLNNQEWQIYHEVNISLFLHLCIQSISLLPCYYLSLLFACNVSPPPPTPPLHAVIRAERSVIRPSEADQPTLNISHNFKWAHMNHRSQAALVSVFVCVCVCGCMCVCVEVLKPGAPSNNLWLSVSVRRSDVEFRSNGASRSPEA